MKSPGVMLAVIAVLVVVFMAIECALRRSPMWERKRWMHALHNALLFAPFFALSGYMSAHYYRSLGGTLKDYTWVGMLGRLGLIDAAGAVPTVVKLALGVLFVDLSIYASHRLQHEIPFLWRFHRVHHTDMNVDATTALRHHPVDALTDLFLISLFMVLFSVPPASAAIYMTFQSVNGYFHHSKILLPPRVERALQLVFITPRLHLIHHDREIRRTNSNYAFVFTLWDRLFRTYSYDLAPLRFGLDEYEAPRWHNVGGMLVTPFVATPVVEATPEKKAA